VSVVRAGGPPKTYKAFPGWLCISGSRARRYIRNFYGKLVLTDEVEVVDPGPGLADVLESFRERPER
jgi:hypothetical protein